MSGRGVALALVGDHPSLRRAAAALFPAAELLSLSPDAMRPEVPFRGALFATLGAQVRGACVALVVPVTLVHPPAAEPAAAPDLVVVSDHVNLSLRSPLCGRWPEGMPRVFPELADVYQPDLVRSRAGARVYSAEVVAGVTDATHLTDFEAGALRSGGYRAVSDTLVPAAVIAAYFGLTLAACGVPQAGDRDNE